MLPNENGQEDVYTYRFEHAGTMIRVWGRRATFLPPRKDRNGYASPLSVENLPTDQYCWSMQQTRYKACNSAASVQPASRIAFVGCPDDGQAGPIAPPKGASILARMDPRAARHLAYYKAYQGYGVLAPKGWHCRGWYGSSGGYLVVTPKRLRPPYFPHPKLTGAAVFAGSELGDTSGRFDVAVTAARLFPRVAHTFIESIKAEGLMSDKEFEVKPFPSDAMHYLNDRTVEFMTPAEHVGLGTTGGWLTASALPIRGIMALALPPSEPAQIEIMTRLPAGLSDLTESILGWESRWVLHDEESRHAGK